MVSRAVNINRVTVIIKHIKVLVAIHTVSICVLAVIITTISSTIFYSFQTTAPEASFVRKQSLGPEIGELKSGNKTSRYYSGTADLIAVDLRLRESHGPDMV